MSTSFTLMTDINEERCIALRFWGGDLNGCTVRFAFPEVLLPHLKKAELVGGDGSTETVETLLEKAETVEFLSRDTSTSMHLAHGSSRRGE